MKTEHVNIWFADGEYHYHPCEPGKGTAEIPEEELRFWDAVGQAYSVLQRRLRELDDRRWNQ